MPPPEDRVRGLLDDLVEVIGLDDLPAVAQAAIAHAQFETIHRDLLDDPDGRDIHRFRLVLRTEMGAARKAGRKTPGFVDSVLALLDEFYGNAVQHLSAWVPKAPQLRPKPRNREELSEEATDRASVHDEAAAPDGAPDPESVSRPTDQQAADPPATPAETVVPLRSPPSLTPATAPQGARADRR